MTVIFPTADRPLLLANPICLAALVVWAAGLPAADLILPHMPPGTVGDGLITRDLLTRESR